MAAKAGIERMERLGFGALEPGAGMAALGSLLGGLRATRCTPASLIASVILWDRYGVRRFAVECYSIGNLCCTSQAPLLLDNEAESLCNG